MRVVNTYQTFGPIAPLSLLRVPEFRRQLLGLHGLEAVNSESLNASQTRNQLIMPLNHLRLNLADEEMFHAVLSGRPSQGTCHITSTSGIGRVHQGDRQCRLVLL